MEELLLLIILILVIMILSRQSSKIRELRRDNQQIFDLLRQIQQHISKREVPDRGKSTHTVVTPDVKESIARDPGEAVSGATDNKVKEETPVTKTPAWQPLPDTVRASVPYYQHEAAEPEHDPYFRAPKGEPHISWFAKFKQKNPDFEKFIGENLINKIGILILVLGISFFVKYAIDRNWIKEPLRVGIGILCGGILLTIAHRLRLKYKAFSSIFVAGAVAVFYVTIGIAYHDYHLFSQSAAFIIMVAITAFSTLVAIAYNRQELIILSVLGGFGVPFMVSNGSGNFHVLFSYLAILNISMLAISYFRRWFLVNFIAFGLTTVIYLLWQFNTDMAPSAVHRPALLYAVFFYLIFSISFLLHSIIRKKRLFSYEMAAFISNAAIFYLLGMHILHNYMPDYQGLFTILLALYNLGYAGIIYRKYKLDLKLIYILVGLTLMFATIAVPVQFSGNYITLLWACEAVLLFWLGFKSRMNGFAFVGTVVQGLAIGSLLIDWMSYTGTAPIGPVFMNRIFITGMVLTGTFVLTYRLLLHNSFADGGSGIFRINGALYRRCMVYAVAGFGYMVPLWDIMYHSVTRFGNAPAAWIFVYLFHILYTSVAIWYAYKKDSNRFIYHINAVTYMNLIIFMTMAFRIPILEHLDNFGKADAPVHWGFWLHYPALICLAYQIIQLCRSYRENPNVAHFYREVMPWLLGIVIVFTASTETIVALTEGAATPERVYFWQNMGVKVFFPVLWGLLSFIFLIYGIRSGKKALRIVALALLGLTIIKLFAYDIRDASETGKIIAFILLGVLILIISFVYQKVKWLVIDNHKEHKNDEAS